MSATLTSFGLGNSLMDQFDGIPSIAQSKGEVCNHDRYTIPGCGMDCLWGMTNDGPPDGFSTRRLDCLLVEAFCNGMELGIDGDSKYMGKYYDISLAVNPACRLMVFTQWMSADGGMGNYTWQTLWPSHNTDLCPQYGTAAYHEGLVRKLRTMYPGKQVSLIPVGHVMYLFDQEARAGRIPGYTDAFGHYSDGIHLNANGKYLQNVTAYAVMFKKDPHGAGLSFLQWSGTESVSQAFANKVQDLVWTVVIAQQALTDVTGTAVAGARTLASSSVGQPEATPRTYTIDGRVVARASASHRSGLLVVAGRGIVASGAR
jgi:hypothetical protein